MQTVQKKTIYGTRVPRSTSPHCHATVAAGLVFVSGIPGFDADRNVAVGDFGAQMRQALENIRNILETAGTSLDRVVKVNVFLDDRADFEAMNSIYREYFGNDPEHWPARTTVQARLPRETFLLEIECVALAATPG
jgi:2-iminobutanoate/2-iminopropanoate deaminase